MSETATRDEPDVVEETLHQIQLRRLDSGTWEATQRGLDFVGAGEIAARAIEDFAGKVADAVENGEI